MIHLAWQQQAPAEPANKRQASQRREADQEARVERGREQIHASENFRGSSEDSRDSFSDTSRGRRIFPPPSMAFAETARPNRPRFSPARHPPRGLLACRPVRSLRQDQRDRGRPLEALSGRGRVGLRSVSSHWAASFTSPPCWRCQCLAAAFQPWLWPSRYGPWPLHGGFLCL